MILKVVHFLKKVMLTFSIMLIDNDIKSCALPEEAFLDKKNDKEI